MGWVRPGGRVKFEHLGGVGGNVLLWAVSFCGSWLDPLEPTQGAPFLPQVLGLGTDGAAFGWGNGCWIASHLGSRRQDCAICAVEAGGRRQMQW